MFILGLPDLKSKGLILHISQWMENDLLYGQSMLSGRRQKYRDAYIISRGKE